MSTEPSATTPRYRIGDRVRIDDRAASGHCRAPWYLRGKTGQIAEIQGAFRDPEKLAYLRPGLPVLPLYKVRLAQADIWQRYEGRPGDQLDVDIYENWLQAAEPAGAP